MQRRSLEVLDHEVIGADVVQDADVRMAQRRNGSRFLQRALGCPEEDNALLRFLPSTRQHRVELTVHD